MSGTESEDIDTSEEIDVGDFYEDCSYHPVLCTEVEVDDDDNVVGVSGISLVDGSMPRSCSIKHCAPRKLTLIEAIELRENGPSQELKNHIKRLNEEGWNCDVWWE